MLEFIEVALDEIALGGIEVGLIHYIRAPKADRKQDRKVKNRKHLTYRRVQALWLAAEANAFDHGRGPDRPAGLSQVFDIIGHYCDDARWPTGEAFL